MTASGALLVDIVVELVVGSEGQQDAEAGAQGKVDLSGRVDPHLSKKYVQHSTSVNTNR